MGKAAQVDVIFPDGADSGRLQYEPPRLMFRGRQRRLFEGEALRGVRAEAGDLVLADGSRFRLGERAAPQWAQAIAHPKGRLDKLGVKAGLRAAIINLDDPDFAAELAAAIGEPPSEAGGLDLLFYGADSRDDLARAGDLASRLADRGVLWIVSRKGKQATLKDIEVMAAARAVGLVDTKVCAFSAARTALRFVRRR